MLMEGGMSFTSASRDHVLSREAVQAIWYALLGLCWGWKYWLWYKPDEEYLAKTR